MRGALLPPSFSTLTSPLPHVSFILQRKEENLPTLYENSGHKGMLFCLTAPSENLNSAWKFQAQLWDFTGVITHPSVSRMVPMYARGPSRIIKSTLFTSQKSFS